MPAAIDSTVCEVLNTRSVAQSCVELERRVANGRGKSIGKQWRRETVFAVRSECLVQNLMASLIVKRERRISHTAVHRAGRSRRRRFGGRCSISSFCVLWNSNLFGRHTGNAPGLVRRLLHNARRLPVEGMADTTRWFAVLEVLLGDALRLNLNGLVRMARVA